MQHVEPNGSILVAIYFTLFWLNVKVKHIAVYVTICNTTDGHSNI